MVFWMWEVCPNHLSLFENIYSFISFSLPGKFLSWHFLNKHCVCFYDSLTCWSWHWTGSLDLDIRLPQSVHQLKPFEFYILPLKSVFLCPSLSFTFILVTARPLGIQLVPKLNHTNAGLQISRIAKYAWSKRICVSAWHIGYSAFKTEIKKLWDSDK